MITLGFIAIFIGFIVLSLVMNKHLKQLLPNKNFSNLQKNILTVIGYANLIAGGVICVLSQGVAVGLVYWTGLLTVAALLQSILLTYWLKIIN